MASIVAKMALNTEAQPFTPHAQGMKPGIAAATRDRPKGKGIPMQNARGAMRTIEIGIFKTSGKGIQRWKSGGKRII